MLASGDLWRDWPDECPRDVWITDGALHHICCQLNRENKNMYLFMEKISV